MTTRVLTTAYGAAALDALRTVVADAKRDDPMASVTLLFPNNRAGIVARRHLAHGLTDAPPGARQPSSGCPVPIRSCRSAGCSTRRSEISARQRESA